MKHSALALALLTSLATARAQVALPLPPPTEDVLFEFALPVPPPLEDVLFEAAVEPGPTRDRVIFFAQARPEENRDRPRPSSEPPRPPGAPNPPPPPGDRGERGEGSGGGGGRPGFSTGSSGPARIMRLDSRGRTARPVVVTSKPLDAKELATVEEDLGIMARLLEKEIEREAGAGGPPDALGIAITRLDGRGPSVMLLEGYGAVFTFKVRMPLTPPPARATERKPERPTDSPWERTRRELFGPAGGGGEREGEPGRRGGVAGFGGGGGEGWMARIESPDYDAKKVEELKKSILEALKQAGNIRALKAEDYLTVVVQGGGGGFGAMEVAVETRSTTSTSVNGAPPRVETFVNRGGDAHGQLSSTLTVRARKSDAEEFAKGKLTAEEFAKKALVNVH